MPQHVGGVIICLSEICLFAWMQCTCAPCCCCQLSVLTGVPLPVHAQLWKIVQSEQDCRMSGGAAGWSDHASQPRGRFFSV